MDGDDDTMGGWYWAVHGPCVPWMLQLANDDGVPIEFSRMLDVVWLLNGLKRDSVA